MIGIKTCEHHALPAIVLSDEDVRHYGACPGFEAHPCVELVCVVETPEDCLACEVVGLVAVRIEIVCFSSNPTGVFNDQFVNIHHSVVLE